MRLRALTISAIACLVTFAPLALLGRRSLGSECWSQLRKKTEAIALAGSQPEVFCARASAFVGIASQLIEEKNEAERKIAGI
jgi:hypothetical protein